jgi:hypothetical protein
MLVAMRTVGAFFLGPHQRLGTGDSSKRNWSDAERYPWQGCKRESTIFKYRYVARPPS